MWCNSLHRKCKNIKYCRVNLKTIIESLLLVSEEQSRTRTYGPQKFPPITSARSLPSPTARVLSAGGWIVGDDGGRGASLSFIWLFTTAVEPSTTALSVRRDLSRGDGERGQYGRGGTGGTARHHRPCHRGSGFHFSTTGRWTAHQAQQWSACRRKWGWTRAGD